MLHATNVVGSSTWWTSPPMSLGQSSTLDPARLPQAIQKRCQTGLSFRAVGCHAHEHADAPHVLASLLSARRKRPRCRAAEQRDEVASFQLIELHLVPRQPGPVCRITN